MNDPAAAFAVPENRPIGTVVGALVASDPDPRNSFTYELVADDGDADNSRFTIDANCNLQTNRVFDYEEQSQRFVRVRVK